MNQATRKRVPPDAEPVRVLGRGLRATRGVHLTLRTVREATGKTQVDVAQTSAMDQSDVSRLESREDFDDCQVATFRRYVAALGGCLELVVKFGNKNIAIVGAPPTASTVLPASKAMQRTRRKASRR
jgi:hypothetical protein